MTTDSLGVFNYTLSTEDNFPSGKYYIVANDIAENQFTQYVTFEIRVLQQPYIINIVKPIANQVAKLNEKLIVGWYDKLIDNPSATIIGISREYNYKIEISTDGGNNWKYVSDVSGLASLNEVSYFQSSLTLNEEGNNFKVRVTDNFANSRVAISEPFSVTSIIPNQIKGELQWDYSFEKRDDIPLGVASDGVSRIYLRITYTNNNSSVKNVTVSLEDGTNSIAKYLGKVIPANVIDSYSLEANGANQITAQKSTPNSDGSYWFWYVSPDEFVSNNEDINKGERTVRAKVIVEFQNGNSIEKFVDISITRPPLALVHGFNSDPSVWWNFKFEDNDGEKLLLDDTRFKYRKALGVDPRESFSTNAIYLASQHTINFDYPDRLLNLMQWMRNSGYASNQVYYIGHSMGGDVGREIDKLNLLKNQKTYGKGPIYKLITIDTPHLGSPIADVVVNIIQDYGSKWEVAYPLAKLLDYDKRNLINNLLVLSIDNNNPIILPSGALKDLRTNGGETFQTTQIPSHLIASDFIPGEQNLPDIPEEYWKTLYAAEDFVEMFDKLLDIVAVVGTPATKAYIKEISNLSTVERTLKFIEYMMKAYETFAFFVDSDIIVSVKSQLSDLPRDNSNVTIFDRLYHSWPLTNIQVGDEVNNLLQTNIEGKFNWIPATSKILKSNFELISKSKNIGSSLDQIEILEPKADSQLTVNDQLSVIYSLKDTAGFIYTKVYFQGKSYVSTKPAYLYQFNIPIYANAIDSQEVEVVTIYERNDSSLIEYASVGVKIKCNSNINHLEIIPEAYSLHVNQVIFPNYVVVFDSFSTAIGKTSIQLNAIVSDTKVITFDNETKTFKGISPGYAKATISYERHNTEIYFQVDSLDISTVDVNEQKNKAQIPKQFELSQNYPNPFNPTTQINYSLPYSSKVVIKVFNILGQEIKTVVNEYQNAGRYTVNVDLGSFASGVYIYQMRAGEFISSKKFVLIK